MAKIPNFIACVGDSTTQGSDSTSIPYAVVLGRLLNVASPGNYAVSNRGTGGTVVSQMQTAWLNNIKGKVSGSVPSKRLIIMGGVNDCLLDTAAATAYATLKAIYDDAIGAGWTVIPITCLPFHGYGGWTSGRQTLLATLNASIAGYGVPYVDGYALLGDAVDPTQLSYQGGTKPDYATKTYAGSGGSRDFLHPNDAGHAAIATALAALVPTAITGTLGAAAQPATVGMGARMSQAAGTLGIAAQAASVHFAALTFPLVRTRTPDPGRSTSARTGPDPSKATTRRRLTPT